MSSLNRFIRWCIDNDLAFTHLEDAVLTFKTQDVKEWDAKQTEITDGTSDTKPWAKTIVE